MRIFHFLCATKAMDFANLGSFDEAHLKFVLGKAMSEFFARGYRSDANVRKSLYDIVPQFEADINDECQFVFYYREGKLVIHIFSADIPIASCYKSNMLDVAEYEKDPLEFVRMVVDDVFLKIPDISHAVYCVSSIL